jgi:hypothetical protein
MKIKRHAIRRDGGDKEIFSGERSIFCRLIGGGGEQLVCYCGDGAAKAQIREGGCKYGAAVSLRFGHNHPREAARRCGGCV